MTFRDLFTKVAQHLIPHPQKVLRRFPRKRLDQAVGSVMIVTTLSHNDGDGDDDGDDDGHGVAGGHSKVGSHDENGGDSEASGEGFKAGTVHSDA